MPNPYRDEKGRYKRLEISKELIEQYYVDKKLSMIKVGEKLGVTSAYVFDRLEEFNIPKRSRTEANRLALSYRRKIDFYQRDFTVRPIPEMAYLIGATEGDGCLFKYKGNYMVSLVVKDKDFAETYATCLSVIIGRKFNVRRDTRGYHQAVAFNKRLYNFLKFDITLQKEIIEKYPADYIRGFFDAEGCAFGVITFANNDLSKLSRIQNMLKRHFDIPSTCRLADRMAETLRKIYDGDRNGIRYVLRVKQVGYPAFATKIQSSIARKQTGLNELIAKRDEWGRFKHGDNGSRWVETEKQFMRDNYGKISLKEVARHLHRKETAVRRKAWVMGVAKKR